MLRFAAKPDQIFSLLLHEAVDDLLRLLDTYTGRPEQLAEEVNGKLPRSAALLHPRHIIEQLRAMKTAFTDDLLYRLTAYHWLLLYETLDRYVRSFNEMPEETLLYQQYGISLIDLDGIVKRFFWHTGFLDDLPTPRPEELKLEECLEEVRWQFAPAPVYEPGLYPDSTYPHEPQDSAARLLHIETRLSRIEEMLKGMAQRLAGI